MTDNKTRAFLGPEYSWSRASIQLEDIQSLHGGIRVYLPRWTVGQVYVTRVAPGGQETKYRLPLGLKEKEQLCRLCVEQDFLTIQPEERPGIPDEARPSITLTNAKDESHNVTKWAGVQEARFDAIYQVLLELAGRTRQHKPIPTRLRPWQKALFVTGLLLSLMLLLWFAYFLGQGIVVAWWPEQFGALMGVLILLLVGAPLLMRGLAWRERYKFRGERIFTNPPITLGIGFLFFLALVGFTGILPTMWRIWRGEMSMEMAATNNTDVASYTVFTYTALFAIYFVLAAAALLGGALLQFIDDRF
jgi:hypothetical protein